MSKSFKGLATELVKCLSESDCVKVEKRSIRECAGEKSSCIPSECLGLRETYFNCKRVMELSRLVESLGTQSPEVDMKARIRGNKGY